MEHLLLWLQTLASWEAGRQRCDASTYTIAATPKEQISAPEKRLIQIMAPVEIRFLK
jgi:hypothetical protein